MFNKLPFKKEYILFAGVVVLLLVSYQMAFKKTIALWQVHNSLKEKLALAGDASVQPVYLKRKGKNLENILQLYRVDSAEFRNSVISSVSLIAARDNVKLLEVPIEDPFFRTDKFIIQKLVFQGDYFSLLKTLNKLEQATAIGIIRSVALKLPERGHTSELKMPVMEVMFLSAK